MQGSGGGEKTHCLHRTDEDPRPRERPPYLTSCREQGAPPLPTPPHPLRPQTTRLDMGCEELFQKWTPLNAEAPAAEKAFGVS